MSRQTPSMRYHVVGRSIDGSVWMTQDGGWVSDWRLAPQLRMSEVHSTLDLLRRMDDRRSPDEVVGHLRIVPVQWGHRYRRPEDLLQEMFDEDEESRQEYWA